jgi:hypothetical protein
VNTNQDKIDAVDDLWVQFEQTLCSLPLKWESYPPEVRYMAGSLWRTGFRMGWAEATKRAQGCVQDVKPESFSGLVRLRCAVCNTSLSCRCTYAACEHHKPECPGYRPPGWKSTARP